MEIATSRALEAEVKLAALHLDTKPSLTRSKPQYLAVSEEDDEEPIELPCEEDGCLLMSTLQGQFPGASGLQYRNPESNTLRGIRLSEGRLFPPDCAKSFVCVFPKDSKKKRENNVDAVKEKKRWDKRRCTDLIVLGVPWRTTDEEMRRHFETYGPLVLCTIKRDPKSGESRGYGFIRFQEYDAQVMCVSNRHFIDGRWCDVKIPNSRQQEGQDNAEYNRKVFVGRLTEDITQEDLYQYFSQHGKVTDVFIPRPFRAFAFVTFADQDSAHAILGREHVIKSCTVCVGTAVPKVPHHVHHQQQQQQQHQQHQHIFPPHLHHHHHHQHQQQPQHQHAPFNSVYQAAIAAATYSSLQQQQHHQHPQQQPQQQQQHSGTSRFGNSAGASGIGRNGASRSSGGGGGGGGGSGDPGSSLAQLGMLNPAVLAALGNMFSAGSSAISSPSRANLQGGNSRANDVTKAPGPPGFGPTFNSLNLQHTRPPAIPSDDGHPEIGKGCGGY